MTTTNKRYGFFGPLQALCHVDGKWYRGHYVGWGEYRWDLITAERWTVADLNSFCNEHACVYNNDPEALDLHRVPRVPTEPKVRKCLVRFTDPQGYRHEQVLDYRMSQHLMKRRAVRMVSKELDETINPRECTDFEVIKVY